MKVFSRSLALLLSLQPFLGLSSYAKLTHSGKVDLELVTVDSNGRESRVGADQGIFSLDWGSRLCQVQVQNQYAQCTLDTSQDLKSPSQKMLVHEVPIAHFNSGIIRGLMKTLARNDSRLGTIDQATSNLLELRPEGFDLPFYTCDACLPDDSGKIPVWNAYRGNVLRKYEVKHPSLQGRKLVLKMTLKEMSPVRGSFNIIGNNDVGNFGTH